MALSNQKHVFWEALIITIFIFGIGILLGIFIEHSRATRISEMYLKSEINLLDAKIQTEILNLKDLNCDIAIEKNIEFGNKIYQDAILLEKYEDASRITDVLKEQHKRYDILRALFWLNSIRIKEKCGDKFHTLVYLYDYLPEDAEQENKQFVISRFLSELKEEYGNDILLIPIAKNMNLSSVDLLTYKYNLTDTSIIINEDLIITELEELDKIREYLGKQSLDKDKITIHLN